MNMNDSFKLESSIDNNLKFILLPVYTLFEQIIISFGYCLKFDFLFYIATDMMNKKRSIIISSPL